MFGYIRYRSTCGTKLNTSKGSNHTNNILLYNIKNNICIIFA